MTAAFYADPRASIARAMARGLAPRVPLTVSQWADAERRLSSKGSAEPGEWRTSRTPYLREPMDCMSARSPVHEVVMMFPIQSGKTELAVNVVGYAMDHDPGPIMVALPAEVSRDKWVQQKLGPMLETTEAARRALVTTSSREGANRREFKDFAGGQLYLEHAGSPSRLKSTSVRTMIVDELDEFAANLQSGDDPVDMLEGRTSAFPATYKRLYISTPGILGVSRIHAKYQASDRRRYYVPCPHCGHRQPLEWSGLHWQAGARGAWYMCRECAAVIDEHHKTEMIAAGMWVAENPGARTRGYHLNCLYYSLGLGPRWADLAEMWQAAQQDPARLKTFLNDRLAEPWEDPAMRAVRHNVLADRAESYRLRTAPEGVLAITAGVDTQDNRLAVQIVGWGRQLVAWTLDYVELPGDPAEDAVWHALVALLTRPIEHALGGALPVAAVCIDAGGHRTEAVKAFVRDARLRRCLAIFGAVPNTAPVLSAGKLQDVDWKGRYDKRGVMIHHVGTVGIKHMLYSRLGTDAEKTVEQRLVHFSDELPPEWVAGLVIERYNPLRNRFEKMRGARNEPLDTWVYAYAATHHPELRLHRRSRMEWDAVAARLRDAAAKPIETRPVAAPRASAPPRRKLGGMR